MRYYEIMVKTTSVAAELAADFMHELGSGGVAVYDSADLLSLYSGEIYWDYIDESLLKTNLVVRVVGYFPEESASAVTEELEKKMALLRDGGYLNVGSGEISGCVKDDEDWSEVWKKYYKPIPLNCITIVPDWLKYQPAKDEKIIRINPGKAFGTGEHETTRLCLELYSGLEGAKDVIDVGTGSGILGVSAVILGARHAYMYDLDAEAAACARENAELNGVTHKCTVEVSDLIGGSVKGDVIFANITADILIRLAGDLPKHVREGGSVILSGIIHKRLDEVKDAYRSSGFDVKAVKTAGEWCGILLEA